MAWAPVLRRLSLLGFLLSAAILALAWWMGRGLPEPDALLPRVASAPVQGPTDAAPFDFEYKGKRCEVQPVATWELAGLVVSHNEIRSFSDIYHDATSVDTRDLCVIWGENATSGAYREVEFWSGPFTCYWSRAPETRFRRAEISNQHLITDRPEIRRALERLHPGDQVRLTGLLVDYRMEDWGDSWRRTSTSRSDSGCEVVFLDGLEVLARHRPGWHVAKRAAKALLILFPLAWLGVSVVEAHRGRIS